MSRTSKKNIKEEINKEESKYPKVVLGLDISTACIGVSVVFDDGENIPQLLEVTHIIPKIPSKKTGIEALILRKDIFERDFLSVIKNKYKITDCIIESPLCYATGNSNAHTVSQLLQFNGLLSEAVYRVLNIVPSYISSYDARMRSFPQLLSIRKFNKKGIIYPINHIKNAIKKDQLVAFGSYPFDCDKKSVMMDMVNEQYPYIEWVKDKNGSIKKENYDACDSLVCALAYINDQRYGEFKPTIVCSMINETEDKCVFEYTIRAYEKTYTKKLSIDKEKK